PRLRSGCRVPGPIDRARLRRDARARRKVSTGKVSPNVTPIVPTHSAPTNTEPASTVFFHFCRGELHSPHLTGVLSVLACAPVPRRRPLAAAQATIQSRGAIASRRTASPTRRNCDAILRSPARSPRPHPYVQERIDWNEKRNVDQRVAAGG